MTEPTQYLSHPAAELLPMLDEEGLKELADDIKAHGLKHRIVLYQGMILDGRNRLRACQLGGVTPAFVKWQPVPGRSPTDYVISVNLRRRHLSASQRAMIGADLMAMSKAEAKERQGHRSDLRADLPGSSFGGAREKVAEAVNVSPRLITEAVKVKAEGAPEAVAAVRNGTMVVSAAAAEIRSARRRHPANSTANTSNGPEAKKRWALPWPVAEMATVIRSTRSAADVEELARLLAEPSAVPSDTRPLPAAAGATSE